MHPDRSRALNASAPWHLDPAKARVARIYDAAAGSFDLEATAFWARHGKATIDRLELAEGASVLDVGCGSGASALPAAAAVGPEGRVLGIDLSLKLLERAHRKATRQGLANVAFRQADMAATGLPDKAFDAVVCVFAIFFAEDMERQVAELWRMVRPGGQLAITTWGPKMFAPLTGCFWDAVERERLDLVQPGSPWDRITEVAAVRALLQAAGAMDVRVAAPSDSQPLDGPEDAWAVVMGSGLRRPVDAMDRVTAARVRDRFIRVIEQRGITEIDTAAIYASARKPVAGQSPLEQVYDSAGAFLTAL